MGVEDPSLRYRMTKDSEVSCIQSNNLLQEKSMHDI
ncbi:MAG: hypothetical protein JWR67_731 [Mucilaginibacter sp.]|nr:hypothetical protein [Mucilaginibacter sp.]